VKLGMNIMAFEVAYICWRHQYYYRILTADMQICTIRTIPALTKEFLIFFAKIKPKITNYFAEGRTIIPVSIQSDISCTEHYVTANLLCMVMEKRRENALCIKEC
jgi:hypothetical protein